MGEKPHRTSCTCFPYLLLMSEREAQPLAWLSRGLTHAHTEQEASRARALLDGEQLKRGVYCSSHGGIRLGALASTPPPPPPPPRPEPPRPEPALDERQRQL